jgi:hypothetical protein
MDNPAFKIGDHVQIPVIEIVDSVPTREITLYGIITTAVDVPIMGWMYQLELNGERTESLWPEGALQRRVMSPIYTDTVN